MTGLLPIRICGTGSYVPEKVLDNQHFINYLDTTDEWIVSRTGIRERRMVAPNETTSTMAAEAARRALADANMVPRDIDLILCATATSDHIFPSTACFVQKQLELDGVPAMDVSAACSGFLYGVVTAAGLIQGGVFERILVIGAETLTRVVDREDRGTCILFGDAAGAAILAPAERADQGILHWTLGADGRKTDLIWIPAGGTRLPASPATVAERLHYMHMKGRDVFKFAVVKFAKLVDEALESTGITAGDLKYVIPHQSNLRIIESARERLGLPMEKFANNIEKYGNTSAASVILSLDEARRAGKLGSGDLVLLLAIGAGLTWGSVLLRL